MKRRLAIGGAMVGAAGAALGWTIARKLTTPVGPRRFKLTLRSVERVKQAKQAKQVKQVKLNKRRRNNL